METLCRACSTFRPWIFSTKVARIVDNQAVVSLNNLDYLNPLLKRRLEPLQWLKLQFLLVHLITSPISFLTSLYGHLLAQWKVVMQLVQISSIMGAGPRRSFWSAESLHEIEGHGFASSVERVRECQAS